MQVYIKYCDGGSFAGNKDLPLKTPNGTTVWFRGKSIREAVQNDLIDQQGMDLATDVVVSGCSYSGQY